MVNNRKCYNYFKFNLNTEVISEDREGVLDTILRHKNQYQRRSYQCIKGLVGLFMRIPISHKVVMQHPELKRKWIDAVDWLQEELNRVLLLFCFICTIFSDFIFYIFRKH